MAVILYVEDHRPAQLLMQAIIGEMTAHQLALADSGAGAIAAVPSLHPDLYIIDLDLPDTDGIALAQSLKALHPAPVLLVSAYAESIKESTIKTVALAYLAKPLDPTDVARVIERSLA